MGRILPASQISFVQVIHHLLTTTEPQMKSATYLVHHEGKTDKKFGGGIVL